MSLPAAAPTGEPKNVLVAGVADAGAVGALRRLARELGLAAYAHSSEALKSELQKIVLALHPDKTGGEFRSEGDKARFMKARRAIDLLNSASPGHAPAGARQLAGAPPAITDTSAPTASPDNEHRLQVTLLAAASGRIARYFAAPKLASGLLAAVLLLLVLAGAADRLDGHPALAPFLGEPAVVTVLAALGLAAAMAAAALWAGERAALTRAEHLLSEAALPELFEQARRSARRQGRVGQLSTFDIRRGIDVLADGCATSRPLPPRRLLRRSIDATTRDSITLIQTRRLLARRVIRILDRPSVELLYELSPRAMRETFR